MGTKKFRNLIIAASIAVSCIADANEKPQAEILHWWSSPGESAALDVIINAFKARGGHYYDSTQDSQIANRQEAIERMGKGYPSTLTQWNAGRDVREFYDYGLIDAITDPKLIAKLSDSLPKTILDTITHEGNIVAMPVNIHSENWMWYSTDLLDYSTKSISGDWQQFLELGSELAKKQIPLLAVGDQQWQIRILFTSLFLGISRDVYKDFYLTNQGSTATIDSAEFRRVLEVFNQLGSFSKSFGDGNWNTQVKAVADNKAGATFMGDWAKGEFQTLGKTAGEEYGCALTAGADPSLLLVIDAFILGKVTDPLEKAGQSLMLDVISDPEINARFNQLKGSVSPFAHAAEDTLDVCSKQVHKILTIDDAVIPPYASHGLGEYVHQIDNEIYRLWKASQQNSDTAEKIIETSLNNFKAIMSEIEQENSRSLATIEE